MTVMARSNDFLWRSNGEGYESNTDYQNTFNGSSVSSNGFWSKQKEDVSYNLLQEFWRELTPQAKQKLLKIDKQTLFEHARKNMYCFRCNGLLLEFFSQIVMYGKSLQQDPAGSRSSGGTTDSQNHGNLCTDNGCQDDVLDPSVHPWGGLTTKGGTLTLMDCFLYSKSLKGLQNVFNSARARECERKLLYPDACGGGGQGWISQGGMAGYGRGHGTRETCALHSAILSVETLVDFWSVLGEDTHQSLLRMKEEDFIERLMFRFDNKRFCRECRRNVIREFKELKELKRMRKEPRCTSWFCVADTDFQYEVSCDTVQADWHQTYASGMYHHFEWAIGTEEGKCDIMEFENVGLSVRVQVSGLDLSGLNACYITLRACKMDGQCNELCVKAHALQGKQCVHRRLVVGDGYLSITIGESITSFFDHAEETEEEEEDDSMEKDVNELDGECTRPQKHAKSPELAREFLLDAAVVIFKDQVEKAFREGTARQNAHNIFICLALKLLEERVHVACKEIITSEKQMKLLEEEEKEKREEEERKERKRTKEREKKLRKKERLREKGNKEKCSVSVIDTVVPDITLKDPPHSVDKVSNTESTGNSVSETGDEANTTLSSPLAPDPDTQDGIYPNPENHFVDTADGDMDDHFKYSRRKLKFEEDTTPHSFAPNWPDRRKSENEVIVVGKHESRFHDHGLKSSRITEGGFNKQLRSNATKCNTRTADKYDSYACSCNNFPNEYRSRSEAHLTRGSLDPKHVNKFGNPPNTKRVWEPLDPQKINNTQTNSCSEVTLRSPPKVSASDSDQLPKSSCAVNSNEARNIKDNNDVRDGAKGVFSMAVPRNLSEGELRSNSDNCSSCLSDGDVITSTLNPRNSEFASDSEVSSKTPHRSLAIESATHSESGKENVSTSSQPQSVLRQMHKQSIQYPIFPGSAMGYYHQCPVSWSAVPIDGFMPFSYPNHYLLANSFGYGNAQFMQYMPPPLLAAIHVPVFPPVIEINSTQVEDSNETPDAVVDEGQNAKSEKTTDKGNNNGFSLFHFGGPVALSTDFKTDNAGLKEGIDVGDGNHPVDKKDSVEYNLFGAGNGIKFSIF